MMRTDYIPENTLTFSVRHLTVFTTHNTLKAQVTQATQRTITTDQFHEVVLLLFLSPLRLLRNLSRNGSSKKFHETNHVTRCNASWNLFRIAVAHKFQLKVSTCNSGVSEKTDQPSKHVATGQVGASASNALRNFRTIFAPYRQSSLSLSLSVPTKKNPVKPK